MRKVFGIGSSPRLWGTPPTKAHKLVAERFIPTPVGNTICSSKKRGEERFIPTPVGNTNDSFMIPSACTVHPHACGEHWIKRGKPLSGIGSSPRLWGTPVNKKIGGIRLRFIPTPVGNTSQVFYSLVSSPVHPHACGEH